MPESECRQVSEPEFVHEGYQGQFTLSLDAIDAGTTAAENNNFELPDDSGVQVT